MTGLNEAIAIERGEITGKKTICENQVEKEEEQNIQPEQPEKK